jgi:hypothetical protein
MMLDTVSRSLCTTTFPKRVQRREKPERAAR